MEDPSKRYYDCSALFDKVFYSYVFTGKQNNHYLVSLRPYTVASGIQLPAGYNYYSEM